MPKTTKKKAPPAEGSVTLAPKVNSPHFETEKQGPSLLGIPIRSRGQLLMQVYRPGTAKKNELWSLVVEAPQSILFSPLKVEENEEYEVCFYPGKEGVIVLGKFEKESGERVIANLASPAHPQ